MNIDILAEDLNMDKNDLLPIVLKHNSQYQLGIDTVQSFTRTQYHVLRSLFDPDFMVRVLTNRIKSYDYTDTPGYESVLKWIKQQDLTGLSTKEIKQKAEGRAALCGPQAISNAMKDSGYVNRVIYLDNGKQGRRWFKDTVTEEDATSVSFM